MGVENGTLWAMDTVWCELPDALMRNCSLSDLRSQRTEPMVATAAEVRGEPLRGITPCSMCKHFPNLRLMSELCMHRANSE